MDIFASCRSTVKGQFLKLRRQAGDRTHLPRFHELRQHMASVKPKDAVTYLPWRRRGEKLQTIAVANFKGGSAKTTTSIYLAQYLALQGYRVLAVDLDPQASLTSMLGVQPEFDLSEGDTIYGAIRYDEKRRPLKGIVRKTYFAGTRSRSGQSRTYGV